MSDPFSLAGRVALVTGGATGIGQAVAVGLARAGADVAVTTHNRGADETAAAVQGAGVRFASVPCDLADVEARTLKGAPRRGRRSFG